MPKKIWVVSELYYPEETSTGYLLTKIAEGLAQHYPVNVLCGQPTYAARGLRMPARETHNGVNIQRCLSTALNKDILPFRLINFITISCSVFVKAVQQIGRDDCVLVVTNPPSLPFLLVLACRLRGAKCLLLIHDLYPELLVAVGKVKPHSVLTTFLNWLNKRLYASMERIIVIGRDMRTRALEKLSSNHQRIVFIPNWADVEDVVPGRRDQNALLHELRLTNKFVVQCAGNMGYPNDIESIAESACKLKSRQDIHFLFIGSGAKKRWLEDYVKDNALQNVTILPNQPRGEQSNFINACDAAIITLVAGMLGVSMPSRTYNTLSAGKPIIGVVDARSELAKVVEEEGVGWIVPPSQPDKLVEAILDAQAHPERLAEMSLRARSAAENKYSLDKIIEAYLSVFRSLDCSRQEQATRTSQTQRRVKQTP